MQYHQDLLPPEKEQAIGLFGRQRVKSLAFFFSGSY